MFSFNLDLLPSDSFMPTLHLVAYSVNQKGRSEPTVLEDIAINEAEKRTGEKDFSLLFCWGRFEAFFTSCEASHLVLCRGDNKTFSHHSIHKFACLWCTAWELSQYKLLLVVYFVRGPKNSHVTPTHEAFWTIALRKLLHRELWYLVSETTNPWAISCKMLQQRWH